MEKETKYVLIKWIMLVVLAILVCMMIFQLGRIHQESKHLKDPAILVDPVIIKDRTESIKWKRAFDSVTTKYKYMEAMYNQVKTKTTKKAKQNETNKKSAILVSNPVSLLIRDSLRARYADIIRFYPDSIHH